MDSTSQLQLKQSNTVKIKEGRSRMEKKALCKIFRKGGQMKKNKGKMKKLKISHTMTMNIKIIAYMP